MCDKDSTPKGVLKIDLLMGYSAFDIFSNTASVTEKIAVLETLAVHRT